ncbi:hypothetical protein WMY93_005787 [Mugilogobius chulae]|uniref:Uncharacterized protein n=1 Tax=Mugilogobius chulae TaxID=88201 RepID=A0AAW0PI10_9GOBI
MDWMGRLQTLLLQLLCSASLCLYTSASPVPSHLSPHSDPALELQSECSLRVDPPELVVRFGDPVSVNCSSTKEALLGWSGLPQTVPEVSAYGSFLQWTEESLNSLES